MTAVGDNDTPPALDVVLDVDTGADDALALLLAATHPRVNLLAVTCVAGNVPLPRVVHNTLAVLDHTDAPDDLPVAAGCDRPLLAAPIDASHVHGSTGLAGIDLPASTTRSLVDGHAVDLLRETLRAAERPVTLVTLAPLTNIAMLFRLAPDLVRAKVARVVSMIGAVGAGNVTAAAEFNAYADPEAASVVFSFGLPHTPLTMYGWDVFHRVSVPMTDVAQLHGSPRRPAALAGRLLAAYREVFDLDEPYVGDAGAVCVALDPEGITAEVRPTYVETSGRSRGDTVVDRRPHFLDVDTDPNGPPPPEVAAAVDVDVLRYRHLFLDTLLRPEA